MFPEGAGPGLIYLINFKSDRLAEAARCCLFLSLPTVRYGALWKWEWGKFRHFSRKDQQRKVCVCMCVHACVCLLWKTEQYTVEVRECVYVQGWHSVSIKKEASTVGGHNNMKTFKI